MATSDAPISINSVTLKVNNLEKVSDFYRNVVGLNEISKETGRCTLGQGDRRLLTLIEDTGAKRYAREAGLFHTAFLLPARASLGQWLHYAKANGIQLEGAADHGVSEALYLSDPEGNGVEIYADKDRTVWNSLPDGQIDIVTVPLRETNLLSNSHADWEKAPNGTVIGHVHLQVGDLVSADSFYMDELKLACTSRMDSASFYGSGGYHHHIACNIWNSRGAGTRSTDSTGLMEVELLVTDANLRTQSAIDPWGNRFRVTDS